jgi:phosphoribosylaminoimidazole (AIR) synthetase
MTAKHQSTSSSVNKMFDLLQELFHTHYSQAHHIFNVGETAIGTVPTQKSKIIACNVQRSVGRFTSAERDHNTTAVLCMSATGNLPLP